MNKVACLMTLLLASWVNDCYIRICDASSGKMLAEVPGNTCLAIRPAFSPDGALLASISWDGTVRLFGIPAH